MPENPRLERGGIVPPSYLLEGTWRVKRDFHAIYTFCSPFCLSFVKNGVPLQSIKHNIMSSIIIICIFVLLVTFKIWMSSPKNIGKFGEKRVARKLDWLSKEYTTLNDILLPTHYGTTQIDHIVVSPYGIFVIETKNYKGWIFGHENSEEWKQSLLGKKRFWGWSSEQHKFRNPIRQNEFEDRYNLL